MPLFQSDRIKGRLACPRLAAGAGTMRRVLRVDAEKPEELDDLTTFDDQPVVHPNDVEIDGHDDTNLPITG